jgi:hypothetical protein
MADIESLELKIQGNASGATKSLNNLCKTLEKLEKATAGGCGLDALDVSLRSISQDAGTKLSAIAIGLSDIAKVKVSSSIANQITAIGKATNSLASTDYSNLTQLHQALQPLESLGKSNLGSYLTQLDKLPKTLTALNNIDMVALGAKVREVANAMKPLADEMQKVANGFSALPAKIQDFINSSSKIPASNTVSALSFKNLTTKIVAAVYSLKRIGSVVASWMNKSNEYVENLNLFTVSMGEFAEAAQATAESYGDLLGIDPSEWMRNQGVFMTMATGFGVAGDRAATMSQQLTQLGYDISSFYDTSVEDAMQKLQSGLAGELEPLRRLGYDLSQAKLEATALSLGIDKAVSSMTQAEKAELRYYAIMTQVEQAHGDMGKTLTAPANQMRIFKAQVEQTARSLGNIFIPTLNLLLPYGIAAVKVLRVLADAVAAIAGFTLPEFQEKNVGTSVAEGFEDANKEVAKMKRMLLGIDELNVVSDTASSDANGGSGFDFDLPTYDFLEYATESRVNQIVEEMKNWLGISEDIDSWSELLDTRLGNILKTVGLIGIAFAAWKISNSVHTFITKGIPALKELLKSKSFNITMGVTLAVTGLVIGAGVIQDALTEGLESVNVMDVVSSAGLIISGGALIGKAFGKALAGAAIGAIVVGVAGLGVALYDAIKNELNIANGLTIAFSAALIGAGIGYLVNGALGAAVGAAMGVVIGGAAAGAIWITQNVESTVEKVFGIVSAAALAVGAILAFTGANIPLGVGLMAIGAVSMGSQIAMNTDALSDEVKGVIAVITTAVSGAMLATGALLAFTGANIPLGIALMAGGALTMGASIIPKWNTLSDGVKNTISTITASLGGALLVIGAILAFTGAGLPLGIGLMLAGAASLGTAVALNWESVKNTIKTVLASILAIISGASLALGVILCLTGAGLPLGLGLIMAGIAGSVTAAKLDDNPITKFVKNMVNVIIGLINKVIDAVNGLFHIKFKGLNIGGVEIIPSIDTRLIKLSKIPLMAEGGIVADGQMFIAREAGPELVGSIGNRTAVVNNDQIVSAVSKGVYQAVVQAMGQSGNQTVEAKVNDKVLFEVVVNRNRQETMRTGYNPLLGGA